MKSSTYGAKRTKSRDCSVHNRLILSISRRLGTGPDNEHFTSSSLLIVFNRVFSVSVGLAILAYKTRKQPELGSLRERLKPASPYFA